MDAPLNRWLAPTATAPSPLRGLDKPEEVVVRLNLESRKTINTPHYDLQRSEPTP
jgi:hypothetical protein